MAKTILFSLIGKETIPNYRAYKEFEPDILVHLYSPISEKASNIIIDLVDKQRTKIVPINVDGGNYLDVLKKLHANISFINKEDYVLINITGGTKLMAIALMEFSKNIISDSIQHFYIDESQNVNWYLGDKVDDLGSKLNLDEFINLKGQKIKSRERYKDVNDAFKDSLDLYIELSTKKENILLWKNFSDSVKSINEEYSSLIERNKYKKEKNKSLTIDLFSVAKRKTGNNNFKLIWNDNSLKLVSKDVVKFEFKNSKSQIEWFIFNNGWFELLVANKFAEIYANDDIFMNVVFQLIEDVDIRKNEVDIIINTGDNLIFIECKSGKVTSADINNIHIRKEVYGGINTLDYLVTKNSFNPKKESSKVIIEKCKEFNIRIKSISTI
jgi:hypothetical protein